MLVQSVDDEVTPAGAVEATMAPTAASASSAGCLARVSAVCALAGRGIGGVSGRVSVATGTFPHPSASSFHSRRGARA